MNDNRNNQHTYSDDIDLVILLERLILYFRKYRKYFIIAIFAGIVLGISAYFIFPKLYKSRMILHSSFVTNPEQIQIIDNWNKFLERHEYEYLSTIFNCKENLLHKLSNIEAAEIQKVFTPNNPNGFYVDVKVTDNSTLDELQQGIVYGLENTEYIKARVAARKDDLKKMIEKVNVEINKLDSTKTTIEEMINKKEKNPTSLLVDVSGINAQAIALHEKLLSYQEDLRFADGIIVLQGFSKLKTPVSFSWKVLVILGLILSLSVTYVYTLIRQVNEKLNKLRTQNVPKM
jgi:prefoldin subunit 5